ncbi:MAG: RluA family pseudouridine synthase [Solobacterium sp.]|nr:RluA family pseudouridine synthase [Solobacterium sp.]
MKYNVHDGQIDMIIDRHLDGKKPDDFLKEYLVPDKTANRYLRSGRFLINSLPCRDLSAPLKTDDMLTVVFEPEGIDWAPAPEEASVVYEDAFVYIVHKPAGIIIHSDKDAADCLNAMAARYQISRGIHAPVRPLHRLDRETEGLVIYSKIPFFQPWLDRQLKEKRIRRSYYALCRGKCTAGKSFTVNAPIGKDRHRNGVYRISKTGKQAVTECTCLFSENGYSLFRCVLQTGRTHQIRVHLSSHGFPIVNDPIYGVRDRLIRQMGLWAYEIVYTSPVSGKKHKIKAPLKFAEQFPENWHILI